MNRRDKLSCQQTQYYAGEFEQLSGGQQRTGPRECILATSVPAV